MKQTQLFINGEFLDNGDREMRPNINPATEEVISEFPMATAADVDAAVDAAFEAQKSWEKLPAIERAGYLYELADAILTKQETFARATAEEMGKPLAQAMDEAGWLPAYIQFFAGLARHMKGEIIPSDRPNENIFMYKVPLGVCAGIMPWNFPLFLIGRKVAPALVAGNTVVLKASSDCPNGAYEFAKVVAESSLPKGVINVITGPGGVTGDALCANKKVAMISMTGSTEVGKKIMANAAQNVTKVSLELGGKAPVIVMNDCDLDATVDHVIASRIINTGQVCNAAERVYVQEGIAEAFTQKVIEKMSAVTYGPALGGTFDMGPMVNKKQQEHVAELVQSAIDEGATIACGGKATTVDGKGYFFEPTVVTGCTHEMRIMREEIFGPVLPISTFKTLDEAIEKANDCDFGLTSSIYTTDYDTAMRALNEIKFGETYINREHFEAFQGFHAGMRMSGLGGDDGEHGLEEFLQTHVCYVDYDLKRNKQ
ncbi:MAG: aldehyde dehydrogenase [Eggerthellaceae bacterium]|jgi:lactaldehyde dehydrogenase/glycolaldehyde dehydrogenase|nr:aldehyde dehydrogenase [Eggerthellaceae bacterium]